MAILWMDGFESLPQLRPAYGYYGNIVSVAGRLPNLKAAKGNSASMATMSLGANYPTLIIGFAFRLTSTLGVSGWGSTSANYRLLSVRDGTTDQLSFNQSVDGFWQVRRGAGNGTVLATATTQKPVTDAWHHFEVKFTIHDTLGTVTARIDEQQIFSVSNVDTKNTANAWANSLSIPLTAYYDMDDFYILDTTGPTLNDFIGDNIVTAWRPSGNGATNQFVGSDGDSTDNFELVNDDPPTSSSYVQSYTAGERDLYTVSGASLSGAAIRAVSPVAIASKTGPGARSGRHVIRSEDGTISTVAFETTLVDVARPIAPAGPPLAVDPDAEAWTESKLAATQFGVETV